MLISKVTALDRCSIKNEEIHFVALENIDAKDYSESNLIQSIDGINQLVDAFNKSQGSKVPNPVLPLFVYYGKKSEELKIEEIVKPPPVYVPPPKEVIVKPPPVAVVRPPQPI
jgi:hypothetical protein